MPYLFIAGNAPAAHGSTLCAAADNRPMHGLPSAAASRFLSLRTNANGFLKIKPSPRSPLSSSVWISLPVRRLGGSGAVEYSVSAQKNYDKGLKELEQKDWSPPRSPPA